MKITKVAAIFLSAILFGATVAIAAETPRLNLNARHAYVVNLHTGEPVIAKAEGEQVSIASITKLMTALLIAEGELNMQEEIEITKDDLKATSLAHRSMGLFPGAKFSREELLLLALMSSSNRAAVALARTHPLGYEGFVDLMNSKARELEMFDTQFIDPSGIFGDNKSSAADLIKLVRAIREYPMLGRFSTETFYQKEHIIEEKVRARVYNKKKKRYERVWTTRTDTRMQSFGTTNRLLLTDDWTIFLQKTGYTRAAGYCITMIVNVNGEDYAVVLLGAKNKNIRAIDAIKAKYWIEYNVVPSKRDVSKLNPFVRHATHRR